MQEIGTTTPPATSNIPRSTLKPKARPATETAKSAEPAYVEGGERLSFKTIPFALLHLACLAVFFVDFSLTAATLPAANRSPVAQLAEHSAVNRRVVGSSPTRGASP